MIQNLINNESGRSMVEMLGVLAVIGVLSVGGIAGYRNAMDKRAANEIMNGVSKRAVVASGQLLRNNDFTLSEFESTVNGCTIDKSATTVDTGLFAIDVSGMDKNVCQKLWDMSRGWSVPVDVMLNSNDTCGDTNTITYIFANDLSKNVPETVPEISYKTCESNDDCDSLAEKCENGQCISVCEPGYYYGSSTGTGCVKVENTLPCSKEGDSACYQGCCDTTRGVCASTYHDGSTYVCQADKALCTTNSDCQNGEFCLISGKSSSTPSSGRCLPVSEVDGYNVPDNADEFFKPFVRSKQGMSWWSANNWCMAKGMHLASLAELGIVKPSSSGCGLLASSPKRCSYVDTTKWTEENSYYNAMSNAFGESGYLWTSDNYSYSAAFFMRADSAANVSSTSLYGRALGGKYFAVCKIDLPQTLNFPAIVFTIAGNHR